MTRGLKVQGGDRLGKTIIFAKNQAHAGFIEECFNVHYPHFKGEFARVIVCKDSYAQSLIGNCSKANKAPHTAISVDMLDTGVDVPEVVNLVFFKSASTGCHKCVNNRRPGPEGSGKENGRGLGSSWGEASNRCWTNFWTVP